MKATIRDTKFEIQELRVDNQSVKETAEQKANEVQKYKSEVSQAADYNNNLSEIKKKLEDDVEIAREDRRKLLLEIKEARAALDNVNYKNSELEKVMNDIEYKNGKIERHNVQTQQAIDNVKSINLNPKLKFDVIVGRRIEDKKRKFGSY